MPDEQPLGQLIREFIAALGAYLRHNAAQAVDEALAQPLKRAAKKVAILGLAFGLAMMAAIFLGLALFHLSAALLGSEAAAYALACAVCLLIAALCARGVARDGKASKPAKPTSDG